MRESFSKRTKSLSASPSATPKRSSKPSGSKSGKVSLRQKPSIKTSSSKTSVKATSVERTQKKEAAIQLKGNTQKVKKAVSKSAPIKPTQKVVAKAAIRVVQATDKAAKPRASSQANTPTSSRSSSKSAIVPSRSSRQHAATQALRAFERAVKAFNLRQFSEAKALFEELQQRYHQEVEIISRSQTYIQVCNVRLAGNRTLPRSADEFYDRGVVALNVGNFSQARSFFEKALKLRPDDSHTLYSLAATHAQTGSTDKALTYLRQAVQKQPRLRELALLDTDFSALKDDRRFLELLGATSPFDLLDARRDLS